MTVRKGPFWLAGTASNMRLSSSGRTVAALETWARTAGCGYWAIYRDAPNFHSTTKREYLVRHHEDPYRLARGVPSDVTFEASTR